jgi:AraC-like DNA-binding protein
MFDCANVAVADTVETVGKVPTPGREPDRRSPRSRLRLIDLQSLRETVGGPVDAEPSAPADDSSMMQGTFSMQCLRAGLHLHCTDILALQSLATRAELPGACVKVLLRLHGAAKVRIGGRDLPLDTGSGDAAMPRGLVMRLNRGASFERCSVKGDRQRMVVITLTPEWLDAQRSSMCPVEGHLAIQAWEPSPRAVAIAEQLLNPAALQGPMCGLYLESRVLELVAEAFAQAAENSRTPALAVSPDLRPDEYARACRLRDLLDSGDADGMSLAELVRAMGCNATTLQQQFRLAFGVPVFDYLRASRLQRAALALQHDGVSVARAAEIAGYSSQANFSTAFRRHFGLPPKHYRVKV